MISSLDKALIQNEKLVKECYSLTKKLNQRENELKLCKIKLHELETASDENDGQNPDPLKKEVDEKFESLHKKYTDSVETNAENVKNVCSLKEEIQKLEQSMHKADIRVQELESKLSSVDGNSNHLEINHYLKEQNEEIVQLKAQIHQRDLSYTREINSRNKTIFQQRQNLNLLEDQINRMIFVVKTLTADRNLLRETCAKIGQDAFVNHIALTAAKDQISKLSGKLLEHDEEKTSAVGPQVLIDKLDKLEEHLIELKDSMGTIVNSTFISEF